MKTARSYWTLLLLIGLTLAPACASTGSGGGTGSDRDVLTREQLDGIGAVSAYDAIRRLRPTWLRGPRGQSSFDSQGEGIRVYVDGVPAGEVEALRNIRLEAVAEIRFLDGREATTRFGMNHSAGAIVVRTR